MTIRPLCFASLLLSLVACGALPAPVDAGVDAGPCIASTQTGCSAETKCTVRPDTGASVCAGKGSLVAYAICAADTECVGGTTCMTVPAGNATYEDGQRCRPLCNPMMGAHLACTLGGTCELVNRTDPTVGFCVRKAGNDGGP